MVPLVDIHVHLLAGMDDGPRTMDDALEMCRMAYAQGVRLMSATAHQNERWKAVTPDRIREGTQELASCLRAAGIDMEVFPVAEVTAQPETALPWRSGDLLSVADRGQFMLLEMPRGVFADLRPLVKSLRTFGIRPILAHPEREPGFLQNADTVEELIREGCLVQVSAASITNPANSEDARDLKSWFKRGMVHLLGSDGHGPKRRPPHLADAVRIINRWMGPAQAERVLSTNGIAVLNGQPLRIPAPLKKPRSLWSLPRLW